MVRRLGKHFQVLVRWSERMLRLVALPAGPVSTLKLQRAFAAEAGMIRRAPPKKMSAEWRLVRDPKARLVPYILTFHRASADAGSARWATMSEIIRDIVGL